MCENIKKSVKNVWNYTKHVSKDVVKTTGETVVFTATAMVIVDQIARRVK